MISSLFPFRRQSIFHQSSTPQDPDEIKLKFRRRFVFLSFLVAIVILSIPIFRYRKPAFRALANARAIAQLVMHAREAAVVRRSPTSIQLNGTNSWLKYDLPEGGDCQTSKDQKLVSETIQTKSTWRILFLPEYAKDGIGREVSTICFDAAAGVFADGEPIAQGWLYLLISPTMDANTNRRDRSYQIVLSQHGDQIEIEAML